MIHIEGMGWLGAAVATTLHHHSIPFTWHDTDSPHSAWQACTGLAHPAGDLRSINNLHAWRRYAPIFPTGTVLPVVYAYTHKRPPHDAGYKPRHDLGWIRTADAPCYAIDVPHIVGHARAVHARHRTAAPEPGQPVIVAHGHHARRHGWVWSWSAPVRLHLPDDLLTATEREPVALFHRRHHFDSTYAYPIPSRPGWWWAGTSLLRQRSPKTLDAAAHFTTWQRAAAAAYPTVEILETEPPTQGWRPRARPYDTITEPLPEPGRLTLPAMWATGVRWAPTLLDTVLNWANLNNHHHRHTGRYDGSRR